MSLSQGAGASASSFGGACGSGYGAVGASFQGRVDGGGASTSKQEDIVDESESNIFRSIFAPDRFFILFPVESALAPGCALTAIRAAILLYSIAPNDAMYVFGLSVSGIEQVLYATIAVLVVPVAIVASFGAVYRVHSTLIEYAMTFYIFFALDAIYTLRVVFASHLLVGQVVVSSVSGWHATNKYVGGLASGIAMFCVLVFLHFEFHIAGCLWGLSEQIRRDESTEQWRFQVTGCPTR